MSNDYTVRIVGKVDSYGGGVAFVATPDGTETRVRWDTRRRTIAYRCDEHGRLDSPEDCPHADLVDVAGYWQQRTEQNQEINREGDQS